MKRREKASKKDTAPSAKPARLGKDTKTTKKSSANDAASHRYAATVEKGDNQWKREWSGFISNVKMTEQGTTVKLASCMDHAAKEQSTFSYLFSSPAEKKRAREDKEKLERKKLAEAAKRRTGDGDDKSKMQKALEKAQQRGLQLESMTRKEKRSFLHLTVTEEQQRAEEERQKTFKVHSLMDPKKQWYQQEPHPLDLIAEKLVIKKALKHARQMSLRYNYLTVHPSWVASRARKRKEAQLQSLGLRTEFDANGEPFLSSAAASGGGTSIAWAHVGNELQGKELLNANLSTSFLSSAFVQPSSIGL